jgi:hypothetical protein
MENQKLVSRSRQYFSATVGFGQGFLSKNIMTTLEHPPYFADFVPADYYLFARLKLALTGWGLFDATDIIKNTTEELKMLSQNGFQECFQHLYSHWQKCVVAKGGRFESNVA